MRQHVRKTVVLTAFLLAAFIPTALTTLQPVAKGGNKDQTNKGPSVIKKVGQAQLTAAQIKTISSMPELRRLVSVEGNIIRPTKGNSLWLLTNHSYGLVGGTTMEPHAAQLWTKSFPDGSLYYAACYCPGHDPNTDDGCAFSGSPSELNCHQGGGVDCRCKFADGVIDGPTGAAQVLTPSGR